MADDLRIMMEYLMSTLSFGDVLTIASWIAGGVAFAVGSYFAFKYALRQTTERQDALQFELRKLAGSIDAFVREARTELDAINSRVDAVSDRTTRLEERQRLAESVLSKLEQRLEAHMKDLRDRIDQIILRVGK